MATISLRIRELLAQREERLKQRIRLREIAEATGLSDEMLEELINQRPDTVSLRALALLCDYFNCTPAELLRYEPDEEAPLTLDAREIVERWEKRYGEDEHPKV